MLWQEMLASPSDVQKRKRNKKYKDEIRIATRTIPDHLMFYGLPKNAEGRYTRLQYIKPMAQYLTVKHPNEFGIKETLIKMCTPEPDDTFEKKLENTVIEIEEMFSKKVIELQTMLQEAGINNTVLL